MTVRGQSGTKTLPAGTTAPTDFLVKFIPGDIVSGGASTTTTTTTSTTTIKYPTMPPFINKYRKGCGYSKDITDKSPEDYCEEFECYERGRNFIFETLNDGTSDYFCCDAHEDVDTDLGECVTNEIKLKALHKLCKQYKRDDYDPNESACVLSKPLDETCDPNRGDDLFFTIKADVENNVCTHFLFLNLKYELCDLLGYSNFYDEGCIETKSVNDDTDCENSDAFRKELIEYSSGNKYCETYIPFDFNELALSYVDAPSSTNIFTITTKTVPPEFLTTTNEITTITTKTVPTEYLDTTSEITTITTKTVPPEFLTITSEITTITTKTVPTEYLDTTSEITTIATKTVPPEFLTITSEITTITTKTVPPEFLTATSEITTITTKTVPTEFLDTTSEITTITTKTVPTEFLDTTSEITTITTKTVPTEYLDTTSEVTTITTKTVPPEFLTITSEITTITTKTVPTEYLDTTSEITTITTKTVPPEFLVTTSEITSSIPTTTISTKCLPVTVTTTEKEVITTTKKEYVTVTVTI